MPNLNKNRHTEENKKHLFLNQLHAEKTKSKSGFLVDNHSVTSVDSQQNTSTFQKQKGQITFDRTMEKNVWSDEIKTAKYREKNTKKNSEPKVYHYICQRVALLFCL